ncbi:hypothetical protein BGZ63DRAFT_422928 [Mariannaea sp. PMI_226]|nr:hypothetical protein BGZ63DRAFT_422928 [Mariannaea sp. PMI_226]
MPRLGSQKVKTGCKTCKIRKVKCDETWPQCLRCKKTGRTCDGYQAPPTGSLSWDVLLRPQPSVTPATNIAEVRSLTFFHQVIAPSLSGPYDSSFWTHLVAQATHHEPAARHGVLAISSFFESFSETTCRTADNSFAIHHYNQAIKRLLTTQIHDIDTILTVCALFICIEFLRGDEKAAISHTQHGIRLLSTRGGSSQLAAVFSNLTLFPLFFGADTPVLMTDSPRPDRTFQSIIEAKHCLDVIIARTIWLVRRSEQWQFSPMPCEPLTPAMLDEQRELAEAYDHWGSSFSTFQARRGIELYDDPESLALKIRWKAFSIWVRNCLNRGESIYDKHKKDAEEIIDMARAALRHEIASSAGRPKKFMFDMGFSPLMHFLVLKCRYLGLRVQGLALMKALACSRESLWDSASMQAVGRRVIEIEHGIELKREVLEKLDNDFEDTELPPEMNRVRGYTMEDIHRFRPQEGVRAHRRPVRFLMWGADGDTVRRREMVTVYT